MLARAHSQSASRRSRCLSGATGATLSAPCAAPGWRGPGRARPRSRRLQTRSMGKHAVRSECAGTSVGLAAGQAASELHTKRGRAGRCPGVVAACDHFAAAPTRVAVALAVEDGVVAGDGPARARWGRADLSQRLCCGMALDMQHGLCCEALQAVCDGRCVTTLPTHPQPRTCACTACMPPCSCSTTRAPPPTRGMRHPPLAPVYAVPLVVHVVAVLVPHAVLLLVRAAGGAEECGPPEGERAAGTQAVWRHGAAGASADGTWILQPCCKRALRQPGSAQLVAGQPPVIAAPTGG